MNDMLGVHGGGMSPQPKKMVELKFTHPYGYHGEKEVVVDPDEIAVVYGPTEEPPRCTITLKSGKEFDVWEHSVSTVLRMKREAEVQNAQRK